MIKDIRKPELLMPAGDPETLRAAIIYGADAVYIGGDMYGLRARAKNFSPDQMKESIAFAHSYGRKVYVTVNITAHNNDLEGIKEYLKELKAFGKDKPDALIITDPGVFSIAGEILPEVERHISTQANNTNYETFSFWHRLGAKRAVTAREMSLSEIAELRANIPPDMEIEAFIHGSMCIAYSGRCLLSNYFTGRDANLGECTHSCRWKYYLMEETRPGEYLPIEENERGTYIFNSKDLCMIEYIPELIAAGIDSFKVEGRMKTVLYVATVTRAYRKAIDDYFADPGLYERNKSLYMEEVKKGVNRQFTTGFYFGKPNHKDQIYDRSTYEKAYTYLGTISGERDGLYRLEQKNKFSTGEAIEVIKPDGSTLYTLVQRMTDEEGNDIMSCPHPGQIIYIDLGTKLDIYDMLRRKE